MKQASFDEIGAVLRAHDRFAVLSHVRPDGDALGSQLGLGLSLSKLGKTVMVRNEDGLLGFCDRHQRIAICFVEWSGAGEQSVVADWTVIRDEEDAGGLAS